MPPPPVPETRAGRVTRGQSKDVGAPAVPAPRSVASFPTQVAEDEDAESELAEDAAIAEQLRGKCVPGLGPWASTLISLRIRGSCGRK